VPLLLRDESAHALFEAEKSLHSKIEINISSRFLHERGINIHFMPNSTNV
jgi:hypothetical protein